VIFAEAVTIPPEVLLLALLVFVLFVLAGLTVLIGGFVAIRRATAGRAGPWAFIVAAVAVVVDVSVVVAVIASGNPVHGWWLLGPAAHVLAAGWGRRQAGPAPSSDGGGAGPSSWLG
jgi:hypothetical protein